MKKLIISSCCVVFLAAGCANMSDTQKTTAKGAGIGALAGVAIGAATGGKAGKSAAIGAGVGALGGYIWSQNMEKQKQQMEQATQGSGVSVSQTADNQLKLNIPGDISFETGKSHIQSNFAPILDQFAASLRNTQRADVRIVGHTDNTGSDSINNPLSMNRAQSTRDYLMQRGVGSASIQIDGKGAYQPIATNDTSEGRARNRRVEIFVGERPAN